MEATTSCFCRALPSPSSSASKASVSLYASTIIIPSHPRRLSLRASNTTQTPPKSIPKPRRKKKKEQNQCVPSEEEASISVQTLNQNGNPLGRKELGKCVVRWISQGMRAMASDFASAEIQGEFSELRQRLGASTTATGGLAFVIQAQPYLYAVPMVKGLEALCFKACTHYPTLFDHFQRELRDVLQGCQREGVLPDWRATESWKLLKEFANSCEQF